MKTAARAVQLLAKKADVWDEGIEQLFKAGPGLYTLDPVEMRWIPFRKQKGAKRSGNKGQGAISMKRFSGAKNS